MALSASLRHRRSLTTTVSSLIRSLSSSSSSLSTPPPFTLSSSTAFRSPQSSAVAGGFQFRSFRSSSIVLSQSRPFKPYQEGDEIGPDTILFEGCDYNHWLITMDFPKDPKPSPEEMVRTYEETCAKGLGISIEEAKKKIYACSTTTFVGFQAVMTEAESEKFAGLPGVVFILPDSYIDPVNKEYGGDKYENGVITHRPPPVQYGRNRGGRFNDRNRNPEQQRFNQRGPNENQQGNPRFDQQGDRRNFGPPNNYPAQQNFGPPQNNPQQNFSPQQNYPPQQNFRPQQNYPPPPNTQQNYPPPQNAQQNYPPQQNAGPQQNIPPQQNFPHHQNFRPQQNFPPQQNFAPQQRFNEPGGRENVNQGQPGAYVQGGQNYPGQGGQNYPGQGGQDHPGQNFRGQGGPGFSRGE